MLYHTTSLPCPPEAIPGRVISIVGAGGKSTILYFLAKHHADRGKRVLVTTTTKIWKPDPSYFAATAEAARVLWDQRKFAVIGTEIPGESKLSFPNQSIFEKLFSEADLVLAEADGSKQKPIKVPREGEPVLLPQTDTVLCVMGLSALGQPISNVCFGWQNPEDTQPLTEELAAQILTAEWGGRKDVGCRNFYILLNQQDSPELGSKIPKLVSEKVLFTHFSHSERYFYQKIARGNWQ